MAALTHLIDTPQIYGIIKGLEEGDPLLERIKDVSDNGKLFISVISHGEISSQIDRVTDEGLRRIASQRYKQLVASIGTKHLVSFDEPVAAKWAALTTQFTSDDYPSVSSEALMVAATADYYGYNLICDQQDWHKHLPNLQFSYV